MPRELQGGGAETVRMWGTRQDAALLRVFQVNCLHLIASLVWTLQDMLSICQRIEYLQQILKHADQAISDSGVRKDATS